MVAYLVLLLAVLSRMLPHLAHGTAMNVTAWGAGLLFFGSRLGSGNAAGGKGLSQWHVLSAVAVMAATDWWLTVVGYGYDFHVAAYLIPWLWYAAVCLLSSSFLHGRSGALRVGVGAVASATGFFLISNAAVWLPGTMYPRTGAGLLACYAAGVPFYRNDLVSTLLFSAVFFGAAALVRGFSQSRQQAVSFTGRDTL